jgi:hypothetical protein
MSEFVRSTSQAPQAPQPEHPIDPVAAPKRSQPSKASGSATYDQTQSHGANSRRKNVYFPNARSAKTIWTKRTSLENFLKKAVESETAEVKGVLEKEYTVSTFEQLSAPDKELWEKIAKAVQQLEQSFVLMPHE